MCTCRPSIRSSLAVVFIVALGGCGIFTGSKSRPRLNTAYDSSPASTVVGGTVDYPMLATESSTLTLTLPSPVHSPTRTDHPGAPLPLPSSTPGSQITAAPAAGTPLSADHPASLQKMGEIRLSPWDLVSSLAWSADGKRIAAAAGENVHLYDAVSFQEVQILKVRAWVSRLVFLSQKNVEGYFLGMSVKDGPVQVWDAAQGQQICNFKGHTRGANSVAFSQRAGFLASTGNDGYVRLWEVFPAIEQGICPATPFAEMIGGAFAVSDVEFSPDGALVASASDQLIHLREPGSERLVQTLFGESPLFDLAFSPDGKTLATAEQGAVARLWDVLSGQIVTTLEGPQGSTLPGAFLWSVAFSPDGRWLAGGSSDGSLLLWDLTVQPPRSSALPAHGKAVTSLGFYPVGIPGGPGFYLATGGLDGVVKIWMIP